MMLDKENVKIVSMAVNYTLKGSESEQFMLNLQNRKKFVLEKEQYLLLRLCDGTRKVSEILEEYDLDSQKLVLRFLSNLRYSGIIELRKNAKPRRFLEMTPDPQLQSVHFELTGKCNMKCKHCYQESYLRKPADLSLDDIKKLIQEMRTMQVEKVGISGGEPFLREDLFEIIREFEENEIVVSSILTNGLLLNEASIKKILNCRGEFPLFVSLDGIKPESMKLRGLNPKNCNRVYNRLLDNIQLTVASGIPVMINTVVTKENIGDLPLMYEKLREMNVMGWRIALPKLAGAFVEHQAEFFVPRDKAFNAYLEVIKKHLDTKDWASNIFHLQIEHFFRLEVFENLKPLPPTAFVCDYEGKKQSCCIKPNGDVTPCPLYVNLAVGNVLNQSLESIWYSEKMQKIKNICISDVKECRSCSLNSVCATGCRANAVFLHGSSNAKDDDACDAVKFFISEVAPILKEKNINLSGVL